MEGTHTTSSVSPSIPWMACADIHGSDSTEDEQWLEDMQHRSRVLSTALHVTPHERRYLVEKNFEMIDERVKKGELRWVSVQHSELLPKEHDKSSAPIPAWKTKPMDDLPTPHGPPLSTAQRAQAAHSLAQEAKRSARVNHEKRQREHE